MTAYTCGHCNTYVHAEVGGSIPLPEEGIPTLYLLSSCPRCREPNVIDREIYFFGPNEEEYADSRVFPPSQRDLSSDVPEVVRAAFGEAQEAYQAGCHMSSALMCRRAIEMMARDLGIRRRMSLKKMVKALEDAGHIDQRLAEWANMTRVVGNAAAHSTKPEEAIARDDASDVLAFTEAVLDYVYVYRARFEQFKARQASNDSPD